MEDNKLPKGQEDMSGNEGDMPVNDNHENSEARVENRAEGLCDSPQEQTTPPDVHREFEVEEDWAQTLGMDFDAERVKASQTPPPYSQHNSGQVHPDEYQPGSSAGRNVPPVYVMSPDEMPVSEGGPSGDGFHREPMPETFLLWAVLATVCCCLPAGIVAIVYSSSVSSRYFARDYEGAKRASRNAEIWIIASIVTGVIVNALYMPLSLMIPV